MISNRGKAAVSADATAVGKYHRMINGVIQKRWNILRRQKADFVDYGNLRVRFAVNRHGRTQNVRVLSGDANPIMTDFTLEAIVGARIEPMPPEVLSELSLANGLLEITYNVLIY